MSLTRFIHKAMVDHPRHYNMHPKGIECIDVIETMPFNIGSAIKYLWRCDHKNKDPIADLEKAIWYIEREKQRVLDKMKKETSLIQKLTETVKDNGNLIEEDNNAK